MNPFTTNPAAHPTHRPRTAPLGPQKVALTMLEWTVACSMYLAMPVTKAFRSSKLVLKLGWKAERRWVSRGSSFWSGGFPLQPPSYLIEQRGGWWLDAGLLVWQWQFLQQIHVGQGILQGDLGRHAACNARRALN